MRNWNDIPIDVRLHVFNYLNYRVNSKWPLVSFEFYREFMRKKYQHVEFVGKEPTLINQNITSSSFDPGFFVKTLSVTSLGSRNSTSTFDSVVEKTPNVTTLNFNKENTDPFEEEYREEDWEFLVNTIIKANGWKLLKAINNKELTTVYSFEKKRPPPVHYESLIKQCSRRIQSIVIGSNEIWSRFHDFRNVHTVYINNNILKSIFDLNFLLNNCPPLLKEIRVEDVSDSAPVGTGVSYAVEGTQIESFYLNKFNGWNAIDLHYITNTFSNLKRISCNFNKNGVESPALSNQDLVNFLLFVSSLAMYECQFNNSNNEFQIMKCFSLANSYRNDSYSLEITIELKEDEQESRRDSVFVVNNYTENKSDLTFRIHLLKISNDREPIPTVTRILEGDIRFLKRIMIKAKTNAVRENLEQYMQSLLRNHQLNLDFLGFSNLCLSTEFAGGRVAQVVNGLFFDRCHLKPSCFTSFSKYVQKIKAIKLLNCCLDSVDSRININMPETSVRLFKIEHLMEAKESNAEFSLSLKDVGNTLFLSVTSLDDGIVKYFTTTETADDEFYDKSVELFQPIFDSLISLADPQRTTILSLTFKKIKTVSLRFSWIRTEEIDGNRESVCKKIQFRATIASNCSQYVS